MAARCGIEFDEKTTQADLLFKLTREIRLDSNILDLFHTLRIEGNKATHQFRTRHKEAMDGLRLARTLAIWFHQAFGKQAAKFKPGPFVAPTDPSQKLRELDTQIAQLKAKLPDANEQAESNQQLMTLVAREKEEYAALAELMDAEARSFQQLALARESQLNDERKAFDVRLKAMQMELENRQQVPQQISASIQKASAQISLNEELTRILIDQQLISAGWEADTGQLTYQKGARPEKGKNKAIAEWPAYGNQATDYVLFAGLTPIAVVEAKRENINVAGKILQAERYSRGFKQSPIMQPAWQIQGRTIAWADNEEGHYQIPFVYSCNARPFVKQLAEQSGTWFRDVRELANLARPLHDFHSPEGLLDNLKRSREAAQQALRNEGFAYLKLRDYQQNAIRAVESALADNQSNCLLAMATGTGKTRTIIGLMYRFLKSEHFKRILFLVDRTALGEQANRR
jgi:type I restriction enzyme R subunit